MKRGAHAKKRIKGSTVVIAAMYVLWIMYIAAMFLSYWAFSVFLPIELTTATAACFIVETIALARLKLAKEGCAVPPKKANQFLSRLGINNESELEELTQKISNGTENQDGEQR